MSYPLTRRVCMAGSCGAAGQEADRQGINHSGAAWAMPIVPRRERHGGCHRIPGGKQHSPSPYSRQASSSHQGAMGLEAAMTDYSFAIFDTAIGRCGIAWGPRGIHAVQLPMGSEDKTRGRIRQRYGDIAEGPPPAEIQSAIEGIVELLAGKPNDLADVVL